MRVCLIRSPFVDGNWKWKRERETEREITIDKKQSQRNQTLFSIWWSLTDWQTTFINKTETRKKNWRGSRAIGWRCGCCCFFLLNFNCLVVVVFTSSHWFVSGLWTWNAVHVRRRRIQFVIGQMLMNVDGFSTLVNLDLMFYLRHAKFLSRFSLLRVSCVIVSESLQNAFQSIWIECHIWLKFWLELSLHVEFIPHDIQLSHVYFDSKLHHGITTIRRTLSASLVVLFQFYCLKAKRLQKLWRLNLRNKTQAMAQLKTFVPNFKFKISNFSTWVKWVEN